MSDITLYQLVNPPFSFTWNEKTYEVKKANLSQVVLYQARVKQIIDEKKDGAEALIAAYCIWLILKDKEDGLTEQFILDNTPGAIDLVDLLTTLGFVKPTKETAILKTPVPTTPDSSQPSVIEQDGLLEKSAS